MGPAARPVSPPVRRRAGTAPVDRLPARPARRVSQRRERANWASVVWARWMPVVRACWASGEGWTPAARAGWTLARAAQAQAWAWAKRV
ncbi:hypothetical protein ACIBF5_14335 [Micromonospora sp. NPDC050417]|uniref:hypothetical protein n=1 Tax=Micromonospora sp. NPDC050417 TaxID=3364280 RepID=UPI0037BCE896